MIMLCNFTPANCANCGRNLHWDRYSRSDFNAWCSFRCSGCGMHYQKAITSELKNAAEKSGGDLKEYT